MNISPLELFVKDNHKKKRLKHFSPYIISSVTRCFSALYLENLLITADYIPRRWMQEKLSYIRGTCKTHCRKHLHHLYCARNSNTHNI